MTNNEKSVVLSVRLHPDWIHIIDSNIELGFAESRADFIEQAIIRLNEEYINGN